jgi:hypothetical protein
MSSEFLIRTLEYWSNGVMVKSSHGIMEQWNDGIMGTEEENQTVCF